MSGRAKSIFFWVLQRHTVNNEVELRKVAGKYDEEYSRFHRVWGVAAFRCCGVGSGARDV